jgi:hypothetical protein
MKKGEWFPPRLASGEERSDGEDPAHPATRARSWVWDEFGLLIVVAFLFWCGYNVGYWCGHSAGERLMERVRQEQQAKER